MQALYAIISHENGERVCTIDFTGTTEGGEPIEIEFIDGVMYIDWDINYEQ